jgi:DnaJ-class molecular chaperone
MAEPEVILTPLADPDEESEQHDCNVCHGNGDFICEQGCHTQECDECDGSGRLWPDDSPVPANEVEY